MFIFSNSHDMFNDTYVYMIVRTTYMQFASADFENDRHMNDFGMRVERRMVQVTGRVLPAPVLEYLGARVRMRVRVCMHVCVCLHYIDLYFTYM